MVLATLLIFNLDRLPALVKGRGKGSVPWARKYWATRCSRKSCLEVSQRAVFSVLRP